jgi:diguanylate cyclase (GGDEF)-like protein
VRIEAMDFAGTLAAPIELTVDVPYLWWQTPVARTLMAMCLLLLFWAVLRLRLQHLRKQEDLLREMVKQRTAQLQASDGALRKANDDLHRLSYTDALTGLANRRRLFEALTSQFRNAQAQQRPLGVLMIDLDHFKQLNDSLGHLTGDRCLKEIAQCLLAQLPPQGLAARYGGEEFCVLLPGLDATASTAMAELLRRCVETMPTPCCDSHRPRLTISVGVAALAAGQSGPIHDADALLAAADRALYAAKDAGRNRVKTAQD